MQLSGNITKSHTAAQDYLGHNWSQARRRPETTAFALPAASYTKKGELGLVRYGLVINTSAAELFTGRLHLPTAFSKLRNP